MYKYFRITVLLMLIAMLSAICNAADTTAQTEAQATFKSLYGDEVARTKRTSAIADDIKLAGKLLEAAGTSRSQPELLKLICENAYDLGRRSSSGYDVALEAMHVLSANAPDVKPQCLDKIVLIQQLRYTRTRGAARAEVAGTLLEAMMDASEANASAGNIAAAKMQCLKASRLAVVAKLPQKDAIQARYKQLVVMERTQKLVTSYEKRLKLDPSNLKSREALIKIYLVDMNDPAAAAKWLNEDCDERQQTFIPMIAGDINAIPEPTLMEIGDWYKSMAAEAQLAQKGGMLLRAKAFYQAFIARHTAADIAKTKAIIALSRINTDLKKYGVKDPAKVDVPVAKSGAAFSGVSRRASVHNPTKIPGVRAWTVELRDYSGKFYDVEFSKDSAQLITGGQDGSIRFWDAATGKQLRVLMGHDSEIRDIAWSRDRRTLASASSDKTIRLWDTETGKTTAVLRGEEGVSRMAWSPDALRIASSRGSSVSVWSVQDRKLVGKLRATDSVQAIDWSTSGVLATGQDDGNVTVWNVRTGKPYGHYPLDQYKYKGRLRSHRVYALAYSPVNPSLMAVGFSTGTVKLWKPRSRIFPAVMKAEKKDSRGQNRIGYLNRIKWSPRAKTLAASDAGERGGHVWLWTASGKKKFRIDDQAGSSISNIAWSPDARFLATAADDSASCIIDADAGEVVRQIKPARSRGASRPAYSPDGTLMAYSCRDNTIRIWDLIKCSRVSVITIPTKPEKYSHLMRMRWSPDATKIAFVSYGSGTVHVVNVKSGVISSSLPGGSYVRVNDVAWTADSKKLFVSQNVKYREKVGVIKLWDVATTGVDFSLSNKAISSHYGLAITPDGKTLISTATRGRVNLWNLTDKKLSRTIPADSETVRCIALSPDGKKLATCGDERTVKVWSVSTGEPIFGLKKHESYVYRVAFSPDGTKLVSAGKRNKIGVWDMTSGQNLAWFDGSNWHLHWMKDSKTLAAAGGSGVSFYDAASGARKGVYYHMPKSQGLMIGASGHYSGTADVQKDLIYQAVTASGQSTMSPEDFTTRFGWKNDPTKVKFMEGPQATTKPSE
jgi:WD40 repeat protein